MFIRRGAAAGPSGMTMEHLHSFFLVAEQLAPQVPDGVVDVVRLRRLTALTKPDGGVRGIVAGDVVRRLVARTMSQHGPAPVPVCHENEGWLRVHRTRSPRSN